MNFDSPETKHESTPEDITAMLRLGVRTLLGLGIVSTLIFLAVKRGEFFPEARWLSAPRIEHLPLPQGALRTLSTEVAALAPHELSFTVKKISRPAATASARNTPANNAPIDWKNTPITRAVPGAYIVVYLSRRAVGLVVNGQYIRTYFNAGVPTDVRHPRTGDDGRAPIGDSRIVSHDLPHGQMKLRLSFPSPADAARALKAGKITADEYRRIETAAQAQKTPARLNPFFGKPVYISGDNRKGLVTKGDIAIAPQEMLELWTAVADGTVVMIRP